VTRVQLLLLLVVLAEAAGGGWLLRDRVGPPTPPAADLGFVDPLTADELRALAAGVRTADDWARLGEGYLAVGYFPEAAACLGRAADLAPAPPAHYKHAFVLERLGRLDEADAAYERAAAGLRAPDAWWSIGRNRRRRERPEEAAEAFARCGRLPAARLELALLAAEGGRPAEAAAEAERLAAEFPAAFDPVELLVRLAMARGDGRAEAEFGDRFDRCPERLPSPFFTEDGPWVRAAVGRIGPSRLLRAAAADLRAGRVAAAEGQARDAVAADWSPEAVDHLAEVVFNAGRPADAAALLREAVARSGPAYGLLWRLGESEQEAGRPAEARAAWERAAPIAPQVWAKEVYVGMADMYAKAGESGKAIAFRAKAKLAAGMDAVRGRRPAEAVGPLTEAVGLDPGLAHAWFYLGEAARAENRPADARAAYQKCLAIDPDHGRAARALALVGG
jgi:tetratricopeptide (TPR) repeat protein